MFKKMIFIIMILLSFSCGKGVDEYLKKSCTIHYTDGIVETISCDYINYYSGYIKINQFSNSNKVIILSLYNVKYIEY